MGACEGRGARKACGSSSLKLCPDGQMETGKRKTLGWPDGRTVPGVVCGT